MCINQNFLQLESTLHTLQLDLVLALMETIKRYEKGTSVPIYVGTYDQ